MVSIDTLLNLLTVLWGLDRGGEGACTVSMKPRSSIGGDSMIY